jgi:hypothetical protein
VYSDTEDMQFKSTYYSETMQALNSLMAKSFLELGMIMTMANDGEEYPQKRSQQLFLDF